MFAVMEKESCTISCPVSLRISALNFATKCAELGTCGRDPSDILSLADKVVKEYFKHK
jgi:hypothetical protein